MNTTYILPFSEIGMKDLARVGGKNASLGEMYNKLRIKNIRIPNGFAITAESFRYFCKENVIETQLQNLMQSINVTTFENLNEIGEKARDLINSCSIPTRIVDEIKQAYQQLCLTESIPFMQVAVRSSATSEDLPEASFAGSMESYLNIQGEKQLLEAVQLCYASLYTNRAIKYRFDVGFDKQEIAISVGVQQLVRSDISSSGVAFTIDPDSGFENAIIINGIWGLGENIVKGRVTPDEWMVFKPTLHQEKYNPILKKHCGEKEFTLVFESKKGIRSAAETIVNKATSPKMKTKFSLNDTEVIQLASWCEAIEQLYTKPMDIEWAKDGLTEELYIVQARPETVKTRLKKTIHQVYTLKEKGEVLCKGNALGDRIACGKARIIENVEDGEHLLEGEILFTDSTNPDFETNMKKAGDIITNKGGRTSHAAIVARELGIVAVVGTGNATDKILNGQEITVSCAEGKEGIIYKGKLKWDIHEEDFSTISMPRIAPMFILADPERAFELCKYPNQGVGLMRLEFTISNSIGIHPLALLEPDKILDKLTTKEINKRIKGYESGALFFIDKLSHAITTVAAAFYPKDVIVRLSDFKSNEYANLLGGSFFEPKEENPMIGLRGASRYYSDYYRKGFALECEALKIVRNTYGMKNVKLMVPFCRTVEEGKKVIQELAENGLYQGQGGLEIYMMVEIPSNVILADEFAKIFNGFSIGSNDLTQLTLGIDRDSALINHLFDEENPAVKSLIRDTIRAAKRNKIKVGLCGQAPSDLPQFAEFLVHEGINSISFNPDALIKGINNILNAEIKEMMRV
jgi:pyruvate,water dikinase